jgi:hypothetical protein
MSSTPASSSSRSVPSARIERVVRLVLLAAFVAAPQLAFAYPGQEMIEWARGAIIAPLCLFAVLGSILVALIQPRFMIGALWTLVISFFVFFVIANGTTIISHLQNSAQ